jgi:hypothetical protein
MRLHGATQRTPGLRLVADNFYGVEHRSLCRRATRPGLRSWRRFSTRRVPPA